MKPGITILKQISLAMLHIIGL